VSAVIRFLVVATNFEETRVHMVLLGDHNRALAIPDIVGRYVESQPRRNTSKPLAYPLTTSTSLSLDRQGIASRA